MPNKLHVAAIIPARYGSQRLPGKPLINIGGKTMIERVHTQALKAKLVDEVIVATDDERIRQVIVASGGQAVLTDINHVSGTDRVAEVASKNPHIDIIVNIQGDEPYIHPQAIDQAVAPLLSETHVQMSTLAQTLTNEEEINNPNIVKVVTNNNGFALYFSRAPIPYRRTQTSPSKVFAHKGLYAYKRDCLLSLANLPPSPLELLEGLEQLRALTNGIGIKVITTTFSSIEVNVATDLLRLSSQIHL